MHRILPTLVLMSLAVAANAQPSVGILMNQSQSQFPTIYLPSVGRLSTPNLQWSVPDDQGPTLRVERVEFTGNHSISNDRLQEVFAPFVNRELTPKQIYSLTDLVKQTYRASDLAVTAQVPPQDVVDGVILIEIREARFSGVELDYGFEEQFNVDLQRVEAVAQHNISANPPLRISEMERGQLLAIDLHGVAVSGGHHPDDEGDQVLELWVENTPRYTGTVAFDNAGNRHTGENQLVLTSLYASPLNRGGAAYVNASKSEGLDFASIAYRGPVGFSGATVDIQLGLLHAERSVGGDNARSYSLGYRYPIQRTVAHNLFLTALVERRELAYPLDTFDLVLDGNRAIFGGRMTYSSEITLGHNREINHSSDFQKLSGFIDFTRRYTSGWRYSFKLSGQLASTQLDEAEQILVGGPNGVRGYLPGELQADQGAMINLDLAKQISSNLRLSVFFDRAKIKPSKNTDKALTISSLGTSSRIQLSEELALNLSLARALNNLPGQSTAGDMRFLSSISYSF